jgi:hypothetical protein
MSLGLVALLHLGCKANGNTFTSAKCLIYSVRYSSGIRLIYKAVENITANSVEALMKMRIAWNPKKPYRANVQGTTMRDRMSAARMTECRGRHGRVYKLTGSRCATDGIYISNQGW